MNSSSQNRLPLGGQCPKDSGLIGPRGYLWGCLASSAQPHKKLIGALGIFVEYRQDRATAALSVRHGWATRKGKWRNEATGRITVRQGPLKVEIRL